MDARSIAESTIANGSKSFALASRILPPDKRVDAWLLYSFCRHADDVIDESETGNRPAALQTLRAEIHELYSTRALDNPLWAALRETLLRRRVPRVYLDTLIDGMQMDVCGTTYRTLPELLLYCHRVAGVVGWMMVQVLGISDRSALRPAAQLGLAMQLTNICRDVIEDWGNGRLYLPDDMLRNHGAEGLYLQLSGPFPRDKAKAVARVVQELLALATDFYDRSDRGLLALDARSALAIRTARLVYAEIGTKLRARDCDVLRGRVIVSTPRKLQLLGEALIASLRDAPHRVLAPHVPIPIESVPSYPEDVLP